jgi:hypothetical protein
VGGPQRDLDLVGRPAPGAGRISLSTFPDGRGDART